MTSQSPSSMARSMYITCYAGMLKRQGEALVVGGAPERQRSIRRAADHAAAFIGQIIARVRDHLIDQRLR